MTPDTLYLGLRPPDERACYHYPLIKIDPIPLREEQIIETNLFLKTCTHLLFTSQSAASLFFSLFTLPDVVEMIAVGKKTGQAIEKLSGIAVNWVAQNETAEGVIDLIDSQLDPKKHTILYPHSDLARDLINNHLKKKLYRSLSLPLYTVKTDRSKPSIDLSPFKKIIFTSPSTVRAFIELFGQLPEGKTLIPIGPITEREISRLRGKAPTESSLGGKT